MNKYIPGIVIGVVVGVIFGFLMTFVFPEGPAPIGYGVGAAIFVAYIASNLAGNRKVPQASSAEKQAALQMQPPPGKSLLYVYRQGFVAKLAGLNLQVDGAEFAQLTAPKFTCLVVAPGPHTLTCGFGGLAGPRARRASMSSSLRPTASRWWGSASAWAWCRAPCPSPRSPAPTGPR